MRSAQTFDVIVIGGGHAGTEAALAAARMGARTLLLTQSIETLGQMSCNPAVGGIGKGHLVREIDALGGAMARASDRAGIQFRTLNGSKGPAVRATRAQADRQLYKKAIRSMLESEPRLSIFQQEAADLLVTGETVTGVVTLTGITFEAPAVVLTVGTFLGGRIHVGLDNYQGGRAGDPPSNRLASPAARAAASGGSAEDRDAAQAGRPDARLRSYDSAGQRSSVAGVFVSGASRRASETDRLFHYAYE